MALRSTTRGTVRTIVEFVGALDGAITALRNYPAR